MRLFLPRLLSQSTNSEAKVCALTYTLHFSSYLWTALYAGIVGGRICFETEVFLGDISGVPYIIGVGRVSQPESREILPLLLS